MKLFDWLKKNLGGGKVTQPTAGGDERVRDERFLPKPPRKNSWDKPDPVLSRDEASRWFSASLRTRNPSQRTLAVDIDRLAARGLPAWGTEAELAEALGLEPGTLRWLANHRYDDGVEHYVRFRIPKRRGGHRVIMAPKRRLKAVQRALLAELTSRLPVSEHAHGFVSGRSVASNARPHVGKAVVLRFDLEDFFGAVTFGRVRGYLTAMGYGFDVATCVALLCTEAERQPVEVDGRLCYVPVGHRSCVQGAPTSPSICNAIVMRLDRRLAGLAAANGFAYTRYADDLTFSGDDPGKVGLFLRAVAEIVGDEGFRLNRAKTRVMRRGRRQRVTGVVVNDTPGLSRSERRRLRAEIHQMGADPPADQRARVIGKLSYLRMINPAQAEAMWPDWAR